MDTFNKRFFRADQNQVDLIIQSKLPYAFKIGYLNIYVCAVRARTRIARRYEKPAAFFTLSYFPGEGALPSARTEKQDVHERKDMFLM
jgi:hypothetical protein